MEASGAQGQQGDGGQGDAQSGEAGTGPDFAAMQQALSENSQSLGEMREFLQSQPWQQIQQAQQGEGGEGEQEDPGLDLDLGFLDPAYAATMEPAELEQRLQQTIQQAAEQIADRKIGPVQEGLDEMRRTQEINALVGEFPELGEADTANQVTSAAEDLAKQMNRPELANEPGFWRLVYMAGRAADAAQEESGDIQAPASLESGAGATPGGGGGDMGDLIVGGDTGRRGSGVLPFGGGR